VAFLAAHSAQWPGGIFDRTWYGRVLVERVEGFCTEADWLRAYTEINDFEHELHGDGAIVIKFWLQISDKEQLRRFQGA
jgi:AMP-polyphosphate phosphotransferase